MDVRVVRVVIWMDLELPIGRKDKKNFKNGLWVPVDRKG